MEGWLRKFVEKVKFFQKSVHPKRYFVVDFQSAIMTIKHERDSKDPSDIKRILFRDILDCYLPKKLNNQAMPKGWEHGMYLQTRERLFFLCAKCEEDRNMWMSGFRYLLASTVTVQNIMKDNSKILDQKMKQRTEKMLEKGEQEYSS